MRQADDVEPGDWSDLTLLSKTGLLNRLVKNLDHLVAPSDDAADDLMLRRLPRPLSTLYYLSWLDFEVTQGSLTAYMFNSHGRHASAAAESLRTIGADGMANVLDGAIAIVGAREVAWTGRRSEFDLLSANSVTTPYRGLDGTEELAHLTDDYWTEAG